MLAETTRISRGRELISRGRELGVESPVVNLRISSLWSGDDQPPGAAADPESCSKLQEANVHSVFTKPSGLVAS